MTESEAIEKSSSTSHIEIKIANQENSLDDEVSIVFLTIIFSVMYLKYDKQQNHSHRVTKRKVDPKTSWKIEYVEYEQRNDN